ncbi:hypothetical protein SCHPADRAFT_1001426 [Schizopora paradoxa]|uniref:DUF6533 domain-containing protein n=1 Tax=Schizopora paradoxa TaxID=27342 RepID=A0A0H2RE02_9AGAM|nr:hypothetical protein SCHPADRAFT_1001426 [Schizopora paradoxa]
MSGHLEFPQSLVEEFYIQLAVRAFIVKYVNLSAFIFLVYHCIVNMDDEITYIWREKWNFSKCIYIATKYLAFCDGLITFVYLFNTSLRPSNCDVLFGAIVYSMAVGVVIAETILVIRTWVAWGLSRYIFWYLTLAVVAASAAAVFIIQAHPEGKSPWPKHVPSPIPAVLNCVNDGPAGIKEQYLSFVCVIIFELNFRTVRQSRVTGTLTNRKIHRCPASQAALTKNRGVSRPFVGLRTQKFRSRRFAAPKYTRKSRLPSLLTKTEPGTGGHASQRLTNSSKVYSICIADILLLTLWIMGLNLTWWRDRKTYPLIYVFYRDSLAYIAFLLAVSTANVILLKYEKNILYAHIFMEPQRIVHGVFSAQLVLNARKYSRDLSANTSGDWGWFQSKNTMPLAFRAMSGSGSDGCGEAIELNELGQSS